jgi:hypothetical protein
MTQTGSVAEGRLSDWISLGVLASWVPRDAVDEAVEATGKGAKRKGGKLPPHVMVYFAMALALFADVILSFRVGQGRDLRDRVEDGVFDTIAAA